MENNNQNLALKSEETTGKDTSFHNTINLQGLELAEARKQAETQESKVLGFLQASRKLSFTKHEIKTTLVNLGKMNVKTPESSVSRALSNLNKQGKILKLEEMRLGEFDKPNHLWTIASEPLPTGTQLEMFK